MKKATIILLALAFLFTLATPEFTNAQDGGPIRVGSKQFNEQLVLGQLMLVALEYNGYEVEDRTGLASTVVARQALLNDEIDMYAEYNGTGISIHFNDVDIVDADEIIQYSGDSFASYAIVSSLDAAINDLIWLQPAPANNTYVFVVKREFAEEHGIYTAQDLADYVNLGGEVVVSTGNEFATREDGIPAYEETYGFAFPDGSLNIIADGTPAQCLQALNESAGGANVAMSYGTTGENTAYDIVVLEDPDGAQPVYAPAPVVRGEVLRANPEIATILNPIFATLDNATLQTLNARVGVQGEAPRDVAEDYLRQMGFID
ncbi:MAG: ABC transporter substrate-binding protein [Chloroflexi bacterium]|nr:ABC transporter substrate-binding protein [Chloroflexota bacterium]